MYLIFKSAKNIDEHEGDFQFRRGIIGIATYVVPVKDFHNQGTGSMLKIVDCSKCTRP